MVEGEFSRGYVLCSEAAVVFCPTDDALLCVGGDMGIHEANDLVRRHERKFVHPCNPKHVEQTKAMGSGWGTLAIKDDPIPLPMGSIFCDNQKLGVAALGDRLGVDWPPLPMTADHQGDGQLFGRLVKFEPKEGMRHKTN